MGVDVMLGVIDMLADSAVIWGVGVMHRHDTRGFNKMAIFHHIPPKLGGLCLKIPF